MPSLESVKQFRAKMFEESMAIIEKKGHDYNRQQQHDGDTLFNLRVAALLGIVSSPEVGILVRLSDKFMRLISLMGADVDPAVTDEPVRDTVRDFHNYIDYALQLNEERKQEEQKVRTRDRSVQEQMEGGVVPTTTGAYRKGLGLRDYEKAYEGRG